MSGAPGLSVEFIDQNGGGPGVRLRERQRGKSPKRRQNGANFEIERRETGT
jgi:hypothetical protein